MSFSMEESLRLFAFLILLFLLGLSYTNRGTELKTKESSDIDWSEDAQGGKYIRLIFIGSSECGFSNTKKTHDSVLLIKERLKDFSNKEGYGFISTGISDDVDASKGIEYLNKTGPYDEIIAGARLYNLGIQYYVWDRSLGSPSTPQIIISMNSYNVSLESNRISDITRDEKVLRRAKGGGAVGRLSGFMSSLSHDELGAMIGVDDI